MGEEELRNSSRQGGVGMRKKSKSLGVRKMFYEEQGALESGANCLSKGGGWDISKRNSEGTPIVY